ncbi:MAG: DOMON domain-containing protein [Bacteroidota bacterium]
MYQVIVLFSCLIIGSVWLEAFQDDYQVIRHGGMELRWKISEQQLHCELEAPTQGWMAIGFNPERGLAGTHMIMTRVKNGQAEAEEYAIVKAGDYRPLSSRGMKSLLRGVSGWEKQQRSMVRFSLPLNHADRFRHALAQGTEFRLLMAFSRDDDFAHHSMMRTEVAIKL